MKRNNNSNIKKVILFIFGLSLFFGCTQKAPLEELKMIGLKMKKNEQINYSYSIKSFDGFSGNKRTINGSMCFILNPKAKSLGYNFYEKSTSEEHLYNGDYLILLFSEDSLALKMPLCDYQDGHMTTWPFLELSYVAIQNFLIDSLLSTQVYSLVRRDTIINKIQCSLYSFWAEKVLVDTHKKNKGKKFIKLAVRKPDLLPVFYAQYEFFQMKDETVTWNDEATFSNYSFKTVCPEEIFSIENVPSYYKWDRFKSRIKLLSNSTKAPNWSLPMVSGDSLSLSSLHGKVVLLDFWFIGCGSCIQSIPILNKLQAKFKEKGLSVVGVNLHSDKVEKVREYCKNREMMYVNVWKGNNICNDYLVGSAAPIFYVIDKEGKIAYSQIGHDSIRLENAVNDIMNKLK